MNKYTIIPSSQQYKSAPAVDQDIDISLNQKTRLLTEFDRSASINLEQIFDNESQAITDFINLLDIEEKKDIIEYTLDLYRKCS